MIVLDSYPEPMAPARPRPARPRHTPTPPREWVVVVFTGELDLGSARALDVLDQAVRAHPGAHVLVDLSKVTVLGANALASFADARSRAEADGGVLSLLGAPDVARRLFEIWHLEPGLPATRGCPGPGQAGPGDDAV